MENVKEFYDEIINREEEIAGIKEEMKLAIETFASAHNLSVDGLKKGIKERKEFLKDSAKFLITDADADKVFEAMAK